MIIMKRYDDERFIVVEKAIMSPIRALPALMPRRTTRSVMTVTPRVTMSVAYRAHMNAMVRLDEQAAVS